MPANGDSTITQTFYNLGTMKRVVIDIVADSGDGSVTATALTKGNLDGYLLAMETNPGGTAPTANYDITLVDAEGLDVLGGAGANRHTTTSETVALPFGTYFHHPVMADQVYTVTIANQAVNSAIIKIMLYYSAVG